MYIFESNLLDKTKIYTFRGQQIIENEQDINKTSLSGITYYDNLYVFCLVKNYLYLFDNNQKKIIKELDLNSYLTGKSYSLNPFINETYLSCIISYTEKNLYEKYKINIYEITFLNVNENNQDYLISKREYFNKNNVDIEGNTYISSDSSTCQISANILYCFYFIEDSLKVGVSGFNLSKNYEEIVCNDIFYDEGNKRLYEINSFMFPSSSNNILICHYGWYYVKLNGEFIKKNHVETYCFYYKIQEKKFYKISNDYYFNCRNFQTYYFKETNEYIIGCNDYHGTVVKAFLHNENMVEINNNYLRPLLCDDISNYLIFYNTTSHKYNIITDCYINNNDMFILANHTLFIEKNKRDDPNTNYITPIIEKTEYNTLTYDFSSINEDKSEDKDSTDDKTRTNEDDNSTSDFPFTNEDKSDNNNNNDENSSTNNNDNSSTDFSSTNKENSDDNNSKDENSNTNNDNSSTDFSSTNENKSDDNNSKDENSNTNNDNSSSDSSSTNKDNSDDNKNSDEKSNINNKDKLISDSLIKSHLILEQTDIINLNISINEIIDNITNITNILNKTEIGEDYEINGKDFNLIIKPTNSTFHENSTYVNFQKCEDILRKHYKIPNSTILTFVQLEIYNNKENSLINPVEYEVYDDNKNRLNLSVCNNTEIDVIYSIKDNFNDLSFISSFFDSNIDIFNINDSFYHDICKAYYNSKHDIILKDRIIDIYQKYGVCEEECSYNEFNKEHKTISCSCKTKTKMTNRELTLHVQSYDAMNVKSSPINTDYSIIKCYKVVFSFVDKFKNIGFWIFLILVSTYIPFIFIYLYKGIKSIREYIIREMTKNRYISLHHITKKEILDHLLRKRTILKSLSQRKPKLHSPSKKKEKQKNLKLLILIKLKFLKEN